MNRVYLLLFLSILLYSGCEDVTPVDSKGYRFKFRFITENYKPLNYQEGSELKGLAPELLREICSNLNIPFDVEVLPWDQGYQEVLNNDNAVLFSTVLNTSRRDLFKWAGPYASVDWTFYAASPTEISLNTLDDAKSLSKIGVIKDYGIEQFLVQQGFTNLVYVSSNVEGYDKLLKGELDLFTSDKTGAEGALQQLNSNIWSVTPVMTILTDLVYFAFNKNVPDDVIADFQGEIDKTKHNGVLQSLYEKYMHLQNPPAELQIYTENYPPLTFRNSFGEITGFGSDIVKEIMNRNGFIYPITLSLWSNGYTMIQNNPNFCLFTMDRTPARDTMFQWVGPIGSNKTYFYVKAGGGVSITSVDEAKALQSVGTVSSWFSDQYLRQLGFTNLVSDPDPVVMVQKLISGEIRAFVCSAITFPDIVKSAGFKYSEVNAAFELMSSDFYIAFSKSTPAYIPAKWQSTFESMKQDGTYDAIYKKWL